MFYVDVCSWVNMSGSVIRQCGGEVSFRLEFIYESIGIVFNVGFGVFFYGR